MPDGRSKYEWNEIIISDIVEVYSTSELAFIIRSLLEDPEGEKKYSRFTERIMWNLKSENSSLLHAIYAS